MGFHSLYKAVDKKVSFRIRPLLAILYLGHISLKKDFILFLLNFFG